MRLYNALSDVQIELLKQRRIDLAGDTDADMAAYVRESLIRLTTKDSPDVLVTITSAGGNHVQAMHIYDMLLAYTGKKIGLVVQYTESMAAIILQACDERHCLTHSYIRIHSLRFTSDNMIKLESVVSFAKIKKSLHEGLKNQQRLEKLLGKRTKQSRKKIHKLVFEDRRISAQEALKFGLIDKIV